MGTYLEKFSFSLHHLLTNVSSAVNGCRQNESPNSPFINILRSEKLRVFKKQIYH